MADGSRSRTTRPFGGMSAMTDKLQELAGALDELKRRETENRLSSYKPYPKQAEFHALGATKRERALIAATQSGKTYSASMEMAMHLTGEYPDWWKGRRFASPIRAWAAGVTSESVRDTVQKLLLGAMRDGTGSIPKASIVDISMSRGIPNSVDGVVVRHTSGGVSQLLLKSYEKGREKWQGDSVHVVWFDEEPPYDVFSEGLGRISATKGMVFCTFTPLLGMSDVVHRFLSEPSPDRAVVQMTLDDAGHYTPEERERIIAGYPPHEREARGKGVPMMGAGRIFQTPEDEIQILARNVQERPHWAHLCAVDFGISHPFAWAHLAWDRDVDAIYVLESFRMKDASAADHAAEIVRRKASTMLHVFPHDGMSRDKGSGQALRSIYSGLGINMHATNVTDKDGGTSVWGGIVEMQDRFAHQRLKIVAETNKEFFEEYRMYHMKDGQPVKERDDIISAVRYGIMGVRFPRPIHQLGSRQRGPRIAKDLNYSIFDYDR